MWVTVGAAVIGIYAVLSEMPELHRSKKYKEMLIFSFLVVISLTVYIMQIIHAALPNPLEWITIVYDWLGLVLR